MKDKILLCIPGPWPDRSSFITAVAQSSDSRFLAAGGVLRDTQTGAHVEFALSDPADGLEDAFRQAIPPIEDDTIAQIAGHGSFVSLYSDAASPDAALALAEIATGVLDAGGFAVRVEGARRASPAEHWQRVTADAKRLSPAILRHLFVWAFVSDEDTLTTIGMPFLGHPDIAIKTDDIETANAVYGEFANYLLLENPDIRDGQTIGFETVPGVWRITHVPHIYHDDPDIDFSAGMWLLT